MTFADQLQIAGWLLTVVGQFQVALKQRQGFITWIAANAVLIALCALVGLWWSIGMYATNVAVCVWSFVRWSADAAGPRRLFAKRTPRWGASPWS
ncbi:MAG: hypothetical protein KF863_17325 [Rubrivivax sp.]|jgi:hypothetical protein|nr:hypothetical protein [Rubrivivax sp.]